MQLRLRITGIVAVALYMTIVLLAAWLLLHNIVLVISLGLVVSLLAYSAWLIFVDNHSKTKAGWIYFGLGIFATLIAVTVFWNQPNNIKILLLILILSAVYFGLISIARNIYWQEQRRLNQIQQGVANFLRPYLIVNPKSGNGRAIKANIPELAKQQNIKVKVTKAGDDIETLANQAVEAGADVLGVSGGDGSIGAVAKVALKHNLPMVVLPGGTRCHFARDLGLDPKRIADSLAGFAGVERLIDVGDINGRIFLNNVSLGLYADIVDNPSYRENKAKVSRETLQAVVSGQTPLYDLHFQHGRQNFKKAAQVLIGVGSYNTINLLELGQREKLDSGKLQVTALLKVNDQLVKDLLKPSNFNKLRNLQESNVFQQWQVNQFKISTPEKTAVVGVDGEREKYRNPILINIKPRALRIYVPAEGVRSRPKNIFSRFVFRQLVSVVRRGRTVT